MFFGVDIGGTSIKIGVFDGEKLVEKLNILLDFKSSDEMVDAIIGTIKDKYDNVEGVGIGCPGFITNNFIKSSANIPYLTTINLVEEFNKKVDWKVRLLNDANAAALGEACYCGFKDLLFITLGTGVGGGLVVNGDILEGTGGAGVEIGHLRVDDKYNFNCGCGNQGCLETISSATGIVRVAETLYDQYKTELRKPFSAKAVFDLAKKNDPLCVKVVEEFALYLGKALANACILLDPGKIMIGGGVSNAGEYLLNVVKDSFKKYAVNVVKGTDITLANLGDEAGMYGAFYSVYNN